MDRNLRAALVGAHIRTYQRSARFKVTIDAAAMILRDLIDAFAEDCAAHAHDEHPFGTFESMIAARMSGAKGREHDG